MRPFFAALAALPLAACGGGQVQLDIVELAPVQSAPAAGADPVPFDVDVRAGQLRSVLDAGGTVDLSVFDCAAPAGPGERFPLFFGGEPLTGIAGSQLADDPDTLVRLGAAIPRRALALPRPCARFVGRAGAFSPDIVSQPVPLPRS